MNEKDLIDLKVQLARIEENVSNLPEVKREMKDLNKLATETNHRSIDNQRRLDAFDGKISWIVRTLGATIITGVVGLIMKLL